MLAESRFQIVGVCKEGHQNETAIGGLIPPSSEVPINSWKSVPGIPLGATQWDCPLARRVHHIRPQWVYIECGDTAEFAAKQYHEISAIRGLLSERLPTTTIGRPLKVSCGYGHPTPWIVLGDRRNVK